MGGHHVLSTYLKKAELDFMVLMSSPVFRDRKIKFKDDKGNKFKLLTILQNVKIPTMYILGIEDRFSDSDKTLKLFKEIKNKNIEVKIMKGFNHFFKRGNDDYWYKTRDYKLLYEIDKKALFEIVNWIN